MKAFDWQVYPTETPPPETEIVIWRSNGHRIVAVYDTGYWRWDTGDCYVELRALNGDHWSLIPPLPTQCTEETPCCYGKAAFGMCEAEQ